MTTSASQLVLHPVVIQGVKFGGTTVGRDKIYRAMQYLSRFLAWYLDNKGDKVKATRWIALKSHLGTARKLLRLGKPVEHLQAALRASLSNENLLETLAFNARHIAYFAFLSYDAAAWAHAVKFINLDKETADRIIRRSFQFWFAGITFSLVHGALKSARLSGELRTLKEIDDWGEKDLAQEAARETKLSNIRVAQKNYRRQIALDILDIWIPASGAGLLNVNEGFLGIVGFISSVIGARAQWEAMNAKQ